jgi:hypothetical protein
VNEGGDDHKRNENVVTGVRKAFIIQNDGDGQTDHPNKVIDDNHYFTHLHFFIFHFFCILLSIVNNLLNFFI